MVKMFVGVLSLFCVLALGFGFYFFKSDSTSFEDNQQEESYFWPGTILVDYAITTTPQMVNEVLEERDLSAKSAERSFLAWAVLLREVDPDVVALFEEHPSIDHCTIFSRPRGDFLGSCSLRTTVPSEPSYLVAREDIGAVLSLLEDPRLEGLSYRYEPYFHIEVFVPEGEEEYWKKQLEDTGIFSAVGLNPVIRAF